MRKNTSQRGHRQCRAGKTNAEYTGTGCHLPRAELWKDKFVLCQEVGLEMKRRLGKAS